MKLGSGVVVLSLASAFASGLSQNEVAMEELVWKTPIETTYTSGSAYYQDGFFQQLVSISPNTKIH